MSLLELFRKRAKERPPQEDKDTNGTEELDIYSGMRVEVTTAAGQILFVAKLMGLHGKKRRKSSRKRRKYRQKRMNLNFIRVCG